MLTPAPSQGEVTQLSEAKSAAEAALKTLEEKAHTLEENARQLAEVDLETRAALEKVPLLE